MGQRNLLDLNEGAYHVVTACTYSSTRVKLILVAARSVESLLASLRRGEE